MKSCSIKSDDSYSNIYIYIIDDLCTYANLDKESDPFSRMRIRNTAVFEIWILDNDIHINRKVPVPYVWAHYLFETNVNKVSHFVAEDPGWEAGGRLVHNVLQQLEDGHRLVNT